LAAILQAGYKQACGLLSDACCWLDCYSEFRILVLAALAARLIEEVLLLGRVHLHPLILTGIPVLKIHGEVRGGETGHDLGVGATGYEKSGEGERTNPIDLEVVEVMMALSRCNEDASSHTGWIRRSSVQECRGRALHAGNDDRLTRLTLGAGQSGNDLASRKVSAPWPVERLGIKQRR
jgi:hypothetical protein